MIGRHAVWIQVAGKSWMTLNYPKKWFCFERNLLKPPCAFLFTFFCSFWTCHWEHWDWDSGGRQSSRKDSQTNQFERRGGSPRGQNRADETPEDPDSRTEELNCLQLQQLSFLCIQAEQLVLFPSKEQDSRQPHSQKIQEGKQQFQQIKRSIQQLVQQWFKQQQKTKQQQQQKKQQ